MKKILSILLVLTLVLSFAAGCGVDLTGASGQSGTDAADKWPSGTITLTCGFGEGGSTDIMCRTLAAQLSKDLGVDVVVDNVKGAGGWLCYEQMLKDTVTDGTHLYQLNPSFLLGKYDPANPHVAYIDDCIPLANHESDPNVLVIRSDETRFTDLESLIEYGKQTPVLAAVVATGVQSDDCTTMQYFADAFGWKYETVIVDSAKDSETYFLNGTVDILVVNVGDVFSNYKSGMYNVLCVCADERSPIMSDIPTAKELGYDISNSSDRGYAYPKGVPEEIVKKMEEALDKAMNNPDVVSALNATGAETKTYIGEDYINHLKEYVTKTTAAWGVELQENWN